MSAPITWLLAVKNGMPFLPETLDSLEKQTLAGARIIAWDNGSTDGTVEELKRWIPSRIPGRVVVDQPLGLGASLARMVELSDTEFCARIDADDVCLPDRLEVQAAFLRKNAGISVVGSQVLKMDEDGKDLGPHVRLPCGSDGIQHRMLSGHVLWHPSVLFRRDHVLADGNYRDLQPVEDFDLWMRMASHRKLANLEADLLRYRIRAGSITMTSLRANTLETALSESYGRNAPAVFGIEPELARKLRRAEIPYAWPVLHRILRHLVSVHGGSVLQRSRSHSFQNAAAPLVHPQDVRTRVLLGLRHRSLRTGLGQALDALTIFSKIRLGRARRKLLRQ
jgi:glycosyltransferase involved in cell wall biosynthesis